MNLELSERSYGGTLFRPRPEILVDRELSAVIIATPWGPRTIAQKAIERVQEYLSVSRLDQEATAPFPFRSHLSPTLNRMHAACLLANESLYRNENQTEYTGGVELFCLIVDQQEVSWLQIGQPQIYLVKERQAPLPIGSQLDLSSELSSAERILPPLPSNLLGIESDLSPVVGSFRASAGDQLMLVSHARIPKLLMQASETSLDSTARILVTGNPDTPFWLGLIEFQEIK